MVLSCFDKPFTGKTMPNFIDITGQRFGRWTVIKRGPDTDYKHPRFYCVCDCGTERLVKAQILRNGESSSCGCYDREQKKLMCIERNTTHGMSKTNTYDRWVNLIARCHNKNSSGYHKYGAKDVQVCKRWRESFEAFLEDMGHPPTHKHTLDRINSRGNYEPSNCRWALMKVQQNNRTNNHRIIFNGENLTLQEWSEKTGIPRKTISNRLKRGLSPEDALRP